MIVYVLGITYGRMVSLMNFIPPIVSDPRAEDGLDPERRGGAPRRGGDAVLVGWEAHGQSCCSVSSGCDLPLLVND